MTQLPPTTLTHDHTTPERGLSLADRLRDGEEFAVTFGGQGADWFATLKDLFGEDPDTDRLTQLVEESGRVVAPVAGQLAAALPRPFEPQTWLAEDEQPGRSRHRRCRPRHARRAADPARHPRPARRRGPRPGPDDAGRGRGSLPGHHRRRRVRRSSRGGRHQRRRPDGDRPPDRRRLHDRRPSRRPGRPRRGQPDARRLRRHVAEVPTSPLRSPRPRTAPPSRPSTVRAASW